MAERTKISGAGIILNIGHGGDSGAWDDNDQITSIEGTVNVLKGAGVECEIITNNEWMYGDDFEYHLDCKGSDEEIAKKLIDSYAQARKKLEGKDFVKEDFGLFTVTFNNTSYTKDENGRIHRW